MHTMNIPLEIITARKADAEARKAQIVADLNGIIGEIRVLDAILKEADKPEENPELN